VTQQLSVFGRIKAAFAVVRGTLSIAELAHFFGRGRYGDDRPTKPYSQVAAVYACVRARAEAVAGMPLMVSTGEDQVLESGPLVDLIECPNPAMTRRAFWLATSSILDLFGRVFWVMQLDTLNRPIALMPAVPTQMEAVKDRRTGEVLRWWYQPMGATRDQRISLVVEQVHVILDPDFEDATNPLNGLSPRAAVASAINQYFKADLANEASLDNGVEPSGALVHENGMLSSDQMTDLREEMAEREGVRNRRRPLILYGGWSWQQIAATFSDMEFVELKKLARTDICAAFGTPGPIVNYFEDSNYAHAQAAQEQWYINTIMPRAARLAEEWGLAVLSRYESDRSMALQDAPRRTLTTRQGSCPLHRRARVAAVGSVRRFYAWFDSSGIPAVQRATLQLAEQAAKWSERGVPLNDLIDAYDLPFRKRPWGDTWYKPFGLVDVQEEAGSLPGDDDPDGSTVPDGLLGDDVSTQVDGNQQTSIRIFKNPGKSPEDKMRRLTDAALARLWQAWRQSWGVLESRFQKRVKGHFHRLRGETLKRLHETIPKVEGKSISADQRRDTVMSIVFNVTAANETLLVSVGKLIREAHRLGGEQVIQEAADAGQTNLPQFVSDAPQVQAALRRRDVRITDMNRTVERHLRETIGEMLDDGAGVNEIADAVRHTFNVAGNRARTIAQTEIGGAVEEARAIAMEQAGIPLKAWLWSRKETGRRLHAFTEVHYMENPIPVGEAFELGGPGSSGIMCPHPRATGRADQDINCGCTSISRFPGDNVRSMLQRYAEHGFLSYEQLTQRDINRTQGKDAETCPSKDSDNQAA